MFKHRDLQIFSLKLNKYEQSHPVEVVDSVREINFEWVKF